MRRAVVLGGGGVTGIAWETGVIAGLARRGVDLRQADLFVGTSAGSVVGFHLAHGAAPERLAAQQADPALQTRETFRPYSQSDADARNRLLMDKVGGDVMAARRRIGAYAMRASTPTLDERLAIVSARLARTDWPARALKTVAVDVQSGEARVFDAASGVSALEAIAASCAVPGSWPPVPLGGRHYMDGGVQSITNAQAALGAQQVLILAPFGYSDLNPVAGHLRAEVRALAAAGAQVQVVVPDDASREAIGDNVLDPSRRGAAVHAGLALGQALAADLAGSWA